MNPDRPARPALLAALLLAAAIAPQAQALSSDREQPIDIVADSVDIDEAHGTSTYTGNVEINQGSIRVQADKVVVEHRPGQPRTVNATGAPAKFRQLPDGSEVYVTGTAKQLNYRLDSEELVLNGDAQLNQGKDRFHSDRIVYDRVKSVIKAGAAAQGKERVRVTIQPGQQ